MARTLVWFRRDLRLADHEPLFRAARRGEVIPVFILDNALLHHPETGAARVAFMLACLKALDQELRQRGGRLILRRGDPALVLPALVREVAAEGIYAHTDCERLYGRVRDARVNRAIAAAGFKIRWFDPPGSLPELVSHGVYRQRWFAAMAADPFPTPPAITVPATLASDPLPTLAEVGWVADDKPIPPGGTDPARQWLQDFLRHKRDRYYWQLSYPSAEVTTGLSPYIKFGAISVRECVQTVWATPHQGDRRYQRSQTQLVSRLRWGQGFAQRFRYLPQLELCSLYRGFDQAGEPGELPLWEFDETLYRAWQQGETGFPIVDAAARCLQATGGWLALNFRSRALYASFLSNLLGINWRYGALHFMTHLIDGDCPIDHYQWAMQAGVTHGLHTNWIRIYHPGQRAVDRGDPQGAFIKRWLPELAHLPAEQLGMPPPTRGYPAPILDCRQARQRRLSLLETRRQRLRQTLSLREVLSPLPPDFTPFGCDRVPDCDITWAQQPERDLFPPALDLASLEDSALSALRSWFATRSTPSSSKAILPNPTRPRRSPRAADGQQLSLWEVASWEPSFEALEDS